MMPRPLLLLALLPFFDLTLPSHGAEAAFGEAETGWRFREDTSLTLMHVVEVSADGETDAGDLIDFTLDVKNRRRLDVVDRRQDLDAEEFVRTYRAARGRTIFDSESERFGAEETGAEVISPLEGRRVLFGVEGAVRWADDEGGDSNLLENLRVQPGLEALVPEERRAGLDRAEPGTRWRVDAPSLLSLLSPAGDLHENLAEVLYGKGAEVHALGAPLALSWLANEIDGDGEVRVPAAGEVRGDTIPLLLVAELSGTRDLQDRLAEEAEIVGSELAENLTTARVRWSLDGEGTLEWDAIHQRVRSLMFAGELELVLELGWDTGFEPVTYHIELEGKSELSYGYGDALPAADDD